MDTVNALLERLLVIVRAAPTYLVAVAMVAAIIAEEFGGIAGMPAGVVAAIVRVAAFLTVVVAILRRVTPVLEGARGLLPNDHPATVAEVAALDSVARLERQLGP